MAGGYKKKTATTQLSFIHNNEFIIYFAANTSYWEY